MRRAFLLACVCAAAAFAQNSLWIDLRGEWRMMRADHPEFAAANFDDSAWPKTALPGLGLSLQSAALMPSATRSTGWLRRRVELPGGTDASRLALTVGTLQDVYQVYVNGVRIGSPDSSDALEVAQIPHPRTYTIPAGLIRNENSLQIAIRVRRTLFMPPTWRMEDTGPWLLTYSDNAPRDAGANAIDRWRVANSPRLVYGTLFFVIALLSLWAWWNDRERPELMWFAIGTISRAVTELHTLLFLSVASRPFNSHGIPRTQYILDAAGLVLMGQFVLAALRINNPWVRGALWLGWSYLPLTVLSGDAGRSLYVGNAWCAVFTTCVIAWEWWPRRNRVLPLAEHALRCVLLLLALDTLDQWGRRLLLIPTSAITFRAGSVYVQRVDTTWLLLSCVILALLLRRIMADRRERQRLTGEVQAARAVQQFLLTRSHSIGELPVEVVYEPAQEVGGDFYQVFPLSDGGHLVALGDVSGKGLKAAMTVSMLTGVLRNRKADEPAALLAELNRAVFGGLDGGFVTAAVARCRADGRVTIASAGHPAPYLAGDEVQLTSSFPLGIDPDAVYEQQEIMLGEGQQLTFVSDGVVEATNAKRELFGFDRTRDISGKTASEIAAAAKFWGQDDDITVVTVRRAAPLRAAA